MSWLGLTGLAENPNSLILEIGCGMAYLSDIHPDWHGAEDSKTAVERVRLSKGNNVKIYEEDVEKLSFPDNYFDGIFTRAALEHVPAPNRAFEEIDRVLGNGGYTLIAPAWNCRSWTVKKLKERSWNELKWIERLEKVSIPIRELLIARGMIALPRRLWLELLIFLRGPQPLNYRALFPRFDLIEKYGHESDNDAVADIDPHSCICFYKSRGYKILSHKSFFSRLTARYERVMIIKS